MNPEVWGPPFWFFLHTLALTYPLHTTTGPTYEFQESEVSQIKWLDLEACLQIIRPYNLEKKDLILKINNSLEKYRLIL